MVVLRRIRAYLPLLTAAVALLAAAGVGWWTQLPGAQLTAGQVQELLPPGSTLHSFARVDLDGRPPQEVAVVAGVPRVPGGSFTYYEFVFQYDPWRHRMVRAYAQPLSGPLALSVDGGRVIGNREAAIFVALHEDGVRSYRVVGSDGRSIRVLYAGHVMGRLFVADPLLIEASDPPRALAWDGRAFRGQPAPSSLPWARPGLLWRYSVRHGTVIARTAMVRLQPRQTLRLVATGGGSGAIVVPDLRLDVVENGGFRARVPGTYRIRLLIPFAPEDTPYVLTVIVE